ncbi:MULTISPECIES: hypothetical protein [Psychroflexus]|uniref:Lipoprotein n=1 Tax=Psychroflexus halocasei TaxID=908615 RepID=A0A1H3X1V5_9FLAO|nr:MULTISPECIES: hypothetical protein [Psychroflexus]PJX20723.1 hypothetical protein CAP47_10800 [Psychroflexus sp. S27]SDZ93377.1 hypothetical protein SAMN05421540_102222 [Psychroflexus halocasei]
MKTIFISSFFIILMSCTTLKSTQKDINSGNYKTAMLDAISKIKKDKNSDKSKAYADLLFNAFQKYRDKKHRDIAFLESDSQKNNAQDLYESYREIKYYQDQIRPLLPLKSSKNKALNFKLNDYSDEIIDSKRNLTDQLFSEALDLIDQNNRQSYRKAYQLLKRVEGLNPHYKQLKEMQNIAYQNGVSYVWISSVNQTDLLLPKNFQREILNLETYHLDDFWTVYHNNPNEQLDYDQKVIVEFTDFNFSPERLQEREIPLEREIIEGWEYKKDRRGNYVLDENGNKIKEEIISVAKGLFLETRQSKEVQVRAKVRFVDLYKNEQITSRDFESLFVFENNFAQFKGDPKVLTPKEQLLIQKGFVNFPSNERMLLDAVQDVKTKIKTILKKQF